MFARLTSLASASVEQRRETLLEPHGPVDAFDSERRPRIRQVLPEHDGVAVEIAHGVVAHLPRPIADLIGPFTFRGNVSIFSDQAGTGPALFAGHLIGGGFATVTGFVPD